MFIVKNCIFPCTNKINYTMKESKVFLFFYFLLFYLCFSRKCKNKSFSRQRDEN